MSNKIEKDNINQITQHMGERLTMFHLYHYLGWDVEYVDYVGADIIAVDRLNRKRYAISVKTRKMSETWKGENVQPESRSVTLFRDSDACFLRAFANDMDMEALVAYVIVFQRKEKSQGNNSALLFLIGLDDLEDMRDNTSYVWTHEIEDKKGNIDTGFRLRFGDKNEATLCALCADTRVTWFKMEITDHQIAKAYNLNPKKMHNHLSSEHWKKQQGNFGEYLALWYLGKNHKMRGYHVDSSGADLLFINPENPNNVNEQYAVSVKTFTYEPKQSYEFEKENEEKLKEFARKWTFNWEGNKATIMQPMICFNCVYYDEDGKIKKIYMMAFLVSHVDDESMKEEKYIHRTGGGITIKYDASSLEKIKKDPKVIFTEIDFSNHHYFFE